jgi:hypothetical protein
MAGIAGRRAVAALVVRLAAAATRAACSAWRCKGRRLGVLLLDRCSQRRSASITCSRRSASFALILIVRSRAPPWLARACQNARCAGGGGATSAASLASGADSRPGRRITCRRFFSDYGVWNLAIFAVAWNPALAQALNLVGFGFTFGVGLGWGREFYSAPSCSPRSSLFLIRVLPVLRR